MKELESGAQRGFEADEAFTQNMNTLKVHLNGFETDKANSLIAKIMAELE